MNFKWKKKAPHPHKKYAQNLTLYHLQSLCKQADERAFRRPIKTTEIAAKFLIKHTPVLKTGEIENLTLMNEILFDYIICLTRAKLRLFNKNQFSATHLNTCLSKGNLSSRFLWWRDLISIQESSSLINLNLQTSNDS